MPERESTLGPDIVGTPEAVVDEAYRLISFEPGSEPRWDRFKALFSPRAVLAFRIFPEDDAVTIMDLDDYIVRQMREGMKEDGYSETILRRDWLVFGDVAEARVVFEMKFGEAAPIPAHWMSISSCAARGAGGLSRSSARFPGPEPRSPRYSAAYSGSPSTPTIAASLMCQPAVTRSPSAARVSPARF